MKSALCLFGIVGGTKGKSGVGDPVDIDACYNSYKEHIINENNCDVFIHSWSTEFRDQLLELYKPKNFLIESQIDFSSKVKNQKNPEYLFNAYSRWYSTKKVVELKSQYEKLNNFEYDWVMLGRLDLLFFTDFSFKKLNPEYFQAAIWNAVQPFDQINRSNLRPGLLDLFFVANSSMMDRFSTVYDHLDKYKEMSQHRMAWYHVENVIGDPKKVIQYSLYRWLDFELYRRKVSGSLPSEEKKLN